MTRIDRRSVCHAGGQPDVSPRELSDEVLLLSHSVLASTVLCRRDTQRSDCRLCLSQDVSHTDVILLHFGLIRVREDDAPEVHGHITSLAVLRSHRKLGLATKLMQQSREITRSHFLYDVMILILMDRKVHAGDI